MPRIYQERCHSGGCIGTERSEDGETYTLFDTKVERPLGTIAVHSEVEYLSRLNEAYFTGDPTVMFDRPEQVAAITITADEMSVYQTHVRSLLLHQMLPGESIVADPDLLNLQVDETI